jgi:hypothetical protein
MADYYRYADVLMHASLSETYGNVLGEALWCGTPSVAFADGMGVSSQVIDGHNGILLSPGSGEDESADAAFGRAVVALVRDPQARKRVGRAAHKRAREESSPAAVLRRTAEVLLLAQDHAVASGVRPAEHGPTVIKWLTTLRHVRPWTTYNGLLYLGGHLRPGSGAALQRGIHPVIGR